MARLENRRLAIANAAQGGYLSGLNLELRRPLGDLTGLTEGLLGDARAFGLSPDQRDRIRAIADRSAAMLGVLDRVGVLTELSGLNFNVRPERIDPRWVAHDAMAALKTRGEAKGLTLALSERAAGLSVHADPQRLRQLLLNLLAYAIHDSAPDSDIRLSLGQVDAGVVLTLSAPGVVLSDRQIERLFEPPSHEFEADFDLIGASLSRGVAEAMGAGLIAGRDASSGGLLIDITLPSATAKTGDRNDKEAGVHLLLLTADAPAAAALRRAFRKTGARLFVIAPTDDPVSFVRDLRPDAVLIDATDATEALRWKARLDAGCMSRGAPVLGLTHRHTPGDERHALAAGFTAWTPWPLQTGAVQRIVDTVTQLTLEQKAA